MSFIADRIAGFFSPQASVAGASKGDSTAPRPAISEAFLGGQHVVGTSLGTDFGVRGYNTSSPDMSSDDGGLEEEGRPPYLHVGTPLNFLTEGYGEDRRLT
jgi:hypothetical protein